VTVLILSQDPAPLAVDVSRVMTQRVSVASDNVSRPVLRSSVNAWFAGAKVVSSGNAVDGRSSVTANAFGGFDLKIVPPAKLPPGDPVLVRVTADDTVSSSPIDVSWVFTTIEDVGPQLRRGDCSPEPFSSEQTSPSSISTSIGGAELRALSFTVSNANVEHARLSEIQGPSPTYDPPANQVSFDQSGPNADLSFVGTEGSWFDAGGDWRRITSVQGPNLATYDGAQLTGTVPSLLVYKRAGLDVFIDGVEVVSSGLPQAWSASVTPDSGGLTVDATPPSAFPVGKRVPVYVRAVDADGDVSELMYDFSVGQAQGPSVSDISPPPGSRSMATSGDITFKVDSFHGVNLSTINVFINGVAAVSAGVGVGGFSTSTVTSSGSGYDIDVKSSSPYPEGQFIHVAVSASDLDGRPGERRVWRLQVSRATPDPSLQVPAAGDVVAVKSFDYSGESFGNPVAMSHNGYAYDGRWYENGLADATRVASWHAELGDFPLSGALAAAVDGWKIFKPLSLSEWMSCQAASSQGWTMAGADEPIVSAEMRSDRPIAAFCQASGVVVVDFVDDSCRRITSLGVESGARVISERELNQQTDVFDVDRSLPAGQVVDASVTEAGVFVAQQQHVSFVSDEWMTSEQVIGAALSISASGQRFAVAVSGGAVQAGVAGSQPGPLITELYDSSSTPPLTGGGVVGLDLHGETLCVLCDDGVVTVDLATGQSMSMTRAEMAMTTGELLAISAMPGVKWDYGYFYVSSDDGKVSRVRLQWPSSPDRSIEVDSPPQASCLSAFGYVDDNSSRYLSTAMAIVGDMPWFVMSSMSVSP